ncbi:glycosyltransferase family 2 protein [Nocardioides dongxiaopingii]|uniref:glycosyltransferase family 2 protein n=1 Tax=Nocardioides sp. S-1144 TaxID=2582905 RepID=UPI00110EF890|nr:galactosyltransferase-related protein [Nocardioides sp. S-1144]QCW52597.1 glycosyltransferase family 2 protein [Nocardioides sp. S-1144]
MTRVGVVTIAHGRHDHLEAQHRSLALGTRRPDRYTVVAMGDPGIEPATVAGLERSVTRIDTTALGLPLAAARNQGVADLVEHGADVVVLLDVDCLAGPGLVAGYAGVVTAHPDRLWSGPVTYLRPPPATGYDLAALDDLDAPHPARPAPAAGEVAPAGDPDLFWSLSFATTPAAWSAVGGFCEDYVGYGGEDTDLGRCAAAAGVELWWVGAARAYHQHHPVSSPPVEHLDAILRNGRLFHARWGRWPMGGWLTAFEELGLVRRDGDGWVRA